MKTKTDARLTLSYLRKLERENYLALALVVLLSAAGFCGLLYHIGGSTYPDYVFNIMYPLVFCGLFLVKSKGVPGEGSQFNVQLPIAVKRISYR
jgi:hypothetical protein